MVSVAVRAPAAFGLNVKVIVQVAPAARVVVQVLVGTNSAEFVPEYAIAMVSGAVPTWLEIVTVCGVLIVFTP